MGMLKVAKHRDERVVLAFGFSALLKGSAAERLDVVESIKVEQRVGTAWRDVTDEVLVQPLDAWVDEASAQVRVWAKEASRNQQQAGDYRITVCARTTEGQILTCTDAAGEAVDLKISGGR